MANNRRNSPPIPEDHASATSPILTRSRASSSSSTSVSSITSLNGLLSSPTTTTAAATISGSSTAVLTNGNTSPAATSSTYYPAFPYRNKSRTPSVSSTSTITQPIHSLLQTNAAGILPKRHAAPASAAPTLSTASATASISLASPALSTASASFSTPSTSPTGTHSSKYTMMTNGNTNTANSSNSIDAPGLTNGRAFSTGATSNPTLVLEPINNSFVLKSLELPENARVKIGRQTGVSTAPNPANGYFDSKVLSRVHAEVWSENGKVYIRDVKSSNGTFLNGKRLCPENVESEPFVLNQNDHLEFGIDIMDENGSLLHEKVACKIYISRMSYPTPGGSPQESHAKLQSRSPTGSGSNSVKSNSVVVPGQSTNIDLIISRLQSELTRSQETNADLGALKQGLGELERAIVVSNKEDGKTSLTTSSEALTQAPQAVNYEKLLEENNKAHAAELAKVNKVLEETQAELDAYIQKIQLLEPLVAEDEILRRDIAQSSLEVTKVKLERDIAKDSINELINEHQQAMESLRKEQEITMAVLEASYKENLERMTREAALAQELLTQKHQEDLAKAFLGVTVVPQVEAIKHAEEEAVLRIEVSSLKATVSALQETIDNQAKEIQELSMERSTLSQELSDSKAVVIKTEKELKEAQQQQQQEELSALTPTSPTPTAMMCKHAECRYGGVATTKNNATTTVNKGGSKELVTRYEFSWAQFVFPMGKKNTPQFNQPSTMLMSGGFMLVGIGAYVFWHKGLSINS